MDRLWVHGTEVKAWYGMQQLWTLFLDATMKALQQQRQML